MAKRNTKQNKKKKSPKNIIEAKIYDDLVIPNNNLYSGFTSYVNLPTEGKDFRKYEELLFEKAQEIWSICILTRTDQYGDELSSDNIEIYAVLKSRNRTEFCPIALVWPKLAINKTNENANALLVSKAPFLFHLLRHFLLWAESGNIKNCKDSPLYKVTKLMLHNIYLGDLSEDQAALDELNAIALGEDIHNRTISGGLMDPPKFTVHNKVDKKIDMLEEEADEENVEEAEEEIVEVAEPEESEQEKLLRQELEETKRALEAEKARYEELAKQIEQAKESGAEQISSKPALPKEEYERQLVELQERLSANEKELRACKREYLPLAKIKKTLERDEKKLRRKEAAVAKQQMMVYGVNNYSDIDEEKAKKLAEELDLYDGLKLSVQNCKDVMENNKDRFPVLEKMYYILKAQNEQIKNDILEAKQAIEAYDEEE